MCVVDAFCLNLWDVYLSMTVGKLSGVSGIFSFDSVIVTHVQITRDLGILVEPDLKFKKHISDIINRSNQRSALIFRSFLSLNQNNLLRAYKTYVRPLVEYASPTWSPSLINQIMALEAIQKRFTKRIPNLTTLTYFERLSILKLQSLEHRRLITDLTLCYNIVHKCLTVSFSDFFKFPNKTSPRSHSLHLSTPKLKSNIHRSSFAYRVVAAWNSLPENVVNAPSSKIFKNLINKVDLSKFLICPCIIVWNNMLMLSCLLI